MLRTTGSRGARFAALGHLAPSQPRAGTRVSSPLGHQGSPGSTCSLVFSQGSRLERVGEKAAAHLLAKALVRPSPGAGPSPGGVSRRGGRRVLAVPWEPSSLRAGGAASRPGFTERLGVCAAVSLVRFVCVPRPLLIAHDVNTVVRSSEVGRRRPPSRAPGFPCAGTHHACPACSVRPVLAWGRGVHRVTSQSPGSPCGQDELPHPPDPGPCTVVVACPRPGPFCSPPASGLRALSCRDGRAVPAPN